jgi:ribosome biogenesis GTPase
MNDPAALADFGWSSHFQAQVTQEELRTAIPVRVTAVHRNGLDVTGPAGSWRVPQLRADDEQATIGDWLLIDPATAAPVRLLQRRSLFRRKAAGTVQRLQPIAANVDTLFVVSSCDDDFSVPRLERYLALARDAGVMPVVVLTKADLAQDTAPFVAAAARVMRGTVVECVDARLANEVRRATGGWCSRGQTVALAGSSGVGKSTLINSLLGHEQQPTAAVRASDNTGRHTTTTRSLHRLPGGGWLIDTPGMRELQLADAAEGIGDVFADILEIARECRFHNCRHQGEPGCSVAAAVADGRLDPGRVERMLRLVNEDQRNSEAIWERRSRERRFGRLVRSVIKEKNDRWRK